jgi:hypothetical protein
MLEFSDNVDKAEIQMNVINLPLDPSTPCLRVGQSISALIPPLQILTRKDGCHEASTVGVDPMDDGYPPATLLYLFGGTVHELKSDRSNYTGDLHVGAPLNHMVWQLQTSMSIAPALAAGGGGGEGGGGGGETKIGKRVQRGPPLDETKSTDVEHPSPRIGGTMTSFETNNEAVYGVLLVGGLRASYQDMVGYQQQGIGGEDALCGTTGGAPAQVLLRKRNAKNQWEWHTYSLKEHNYRSPDYSPSKLSSRASIVVVHKTSTTALVCPEGRALVYGGDNGLVHGVTASVLSTSRTGVLRFVLFGGHTKYYGKKNEGEESGEKKNSSSSASFSSLSILEVDIEAMTSEKDDAKFFSWRSVPLETPLSRMGHRMFVSGSNKIWIVGGYGKNRVGSKSKYLNSTLYVELRRKFETKEQNNVSVKNYRLLSNSIGKHEKTPVGYGTLGRTGHSLVILNSSYATGAVKAEDGDQHSDQDDDDDDDDDPAKKRGRMTITVLLYGGVRLYKDGKRSGLEKCTDDVLQVSYSSDGSEQIIQKMTTSGKSPGGLSGHDACLLHEADGSLRGNESKQIKEATRMVVVGGTNPEHPSKGASDLLSVWMLDLVTWCWSKPTMPDSAM